MTRRRSRSIWLTSRSEVCNLAHASLATEPVPGPLDGDHVLAALNLIVSGVPEEEAARAMTWKDFEEFCAQLLRSAGYAVKENVYLSRPRAQIDLVASGPIFVLSIDCKHWKRAPSLSSLERFAQAQLRRSRLLRRSLDDTRPIISAILNLSEPEGTFVNGVAVVPLRALRNFIETVESYSDLLEPS